MQQVPLSRARLRPDFQVFTEISIIAHLANARLERTLPEGMSSAQFGVLNHFARRGGDETPAQLASAFQVTKGAMTHTLQLLERKGFVTIAPHGADGRKKLVSITAEGVVAHGEATAALRPYLEQLREAFTDRDFESALPFLGALRGWLDEHR